MKSLWALLIAVTLGLSLNSQIAEAKRLGGGNSFGSKPSQNQAVPRDSVAPSKPSAPAQGQATQPGAAAPAAAGATPAPRPGMGGLLGGLLAGGLLAALFFGGAFENINLADILIIGVLAFVAFKLFKSFAMRRAPQAAAAAGGPAAAYEEIAMQRRDVGHGSGGGAAPSGVASAFAAVKRRNAKLPAGFDEAAFLAQAKERYTQLQSAWDSGDLGTLRQFSSDKVFAELQDMYRARQGENRTELQRVEASLVDVNDTDDATQVSVLFDVTMIEHDAKSPLLPSANEVAEVWHFVRSKRALRPEWILDGIQQVE